MGCWLGPRLNEAFGVRFCDVNPLRKEIVFGRIVVNQNGSRRFTGEVNKSEEHRTVPVPQPVMDAVVAHIAAYCSGEVQERFLFLPARQRLILRSW